MSNSLNIILARRGRGNNQTFRRNRENMMMMAVMRRKPAGTNKLEPLMLIVGDGVAVFTGDGSFVAVAVAGSFVGVPVGVMVSVGGSGVEVAVTEGMNVGVAVKIR